MANPITQAMLDFSNALFDSGSITEPIEIFLPRPTFQEFRTEILETGKKWESYSWPAADHVELKGKIIIHVRIKR